MAVLEFSFPAWLGDSSVISLIQKEIETTENNLGILPQSDKRQLHVTGKPELTNQQTLYIANNSGRAIAISQRFPE